MSSFSRPPPTGPKAWREAPPCSVASSSSSSQQPARQPPTAPAAFYRDLDSTNPSRSTNGSSQAASYKGKGRERDVRDVAPPALAVWLLSKDNGVAPCFIDDAKGLQIKSDGRTDLFYLKTKPCMEVELVGMLLDEGSNNYGVTYMIDDGSAHPLEFELPYPVGSKLNDGIKSGQSARREADILAARKAFRKPEVYRTDLVRVKLRMKTYAGRLQFTLLKPSDMVKVSSNDESRHILRVIELHKTEYADFDLATAWRARLASEAAAAAKSSVSSTSSLSGSSTLASRSTAAPLGPNTSFHSTVPGSPSSQASTSTMTYTYSNTLSRSHAWSDVSLSSDPSCSSSTAGDLSSTFVFEGSSMPSSSQARIAAISSKDCDVPGLKLWIKDYLVRTTTALWEDDVACEDHPALRYFPEHRRFRGKRSSAGPSACSSFASSASISTSSSSSSISLNPTFSQPPRTLPFSSFSPSPPPSPSPPLTPTPSSSPASLTPPFFLSHLVTVDELKLYASKVVKRRAMEAEVVRKASEKKQKKAPSSSIPGAAVEKPVKCTAALKDEGWVARQVARTMDEALVQLLRDGDLVAVSPLGLALPPPPPTFPPCSVSPRTDSKLVTSTLLLLPLSPPTLGPLLLPLLASSSPSASASRPGIRPRHATPARLLARMQAEGDERWALVLPGAIQACLEEMKDMGLVEPLGRGEWRALS